MAETGRRFDLDFREGPVRLVRETGKPIAQMARDPGVREGTQGNWVNADPRRRGYGTGALLARLRKENVKLANGALCAQALGRHLGQGRLTSRISVGRARIFQTSLAEPGNSKRRSRSLAGPTLA
jgi:transposase